MRISLRTAVGAAAAVLLGACSDSPVGPDVQQVASTAFVQVSVDEETSAVLLAGQNIPVGTVYVKHLGGGEVEVRYQLNAGYCLAETHWAAFTDPALVTNKSGNPQIGKFPYGDDDLGCAMSYTETGDIMGYVAGAEYFVAAHAVVVNGSSVDNPHVAFGIFDAPSDGAEEGDIYGINPLTGDLSLVANLDNTAGPFYPNGLALDPATEMLYYVTNGTNLYRIPAVNADPNAVVPTLVSNTLAGGAIYSATIDGDGYYYMPNSVQQLWRAPLGGGAAAMVCNIDAAIPGTGFDFGDIAADPASDMIFGVARAAGNVIFFWVDPNTCTGGYADPASFDFLLQLAFGPDGTLYGQQALSAGAGAAGQWYELDKATGEIADMLAQTERSFTDIADGLPFTPMDFDETAWGNGMTFSGGSWAMYMGGFTLQ